MNSETPIAICTAARVSCPGVDAKYPAMWTFGLVLRGVQVGALVRQFMPPANDQ